MKIINLSIEKVSTDITVFFYYTQKHVKRLTQQKREKNRKKNNFMLIIWKHNNLETQFNFYIDFLLLL